MPIQKILLILKLITGDFRSQDFYTFLCTINQVKGCAYQA